MFLFTLIFWCLSLLSWIVLEIFFRQYRISDIPFWDWLMPADYFLVLVLLDNYFPYNFQYLLLTFWLIIFFLYACWLIVRSDDQHSLKKFWFMFTNLSGALLLLELIFVLVIKITLL